VHQLAPADLVRAEGFDTVLDERGRPQVSSELTRKPPSVYMRVKLRFPP
jgi:hypothetical protein